MRIWRISNYADLTGRGGLVTAGRWNSVGTPIVYCADHPATSLLEYLVHLDAGDLPSEFQLIEIDVPDPVTVVGVTLPDDWKSDITATRQIGVGFVESGAAAVLKTPSAIVPFAHNYLLNPALVEQLRIRIVAVTIHPIDRRLLE